MCTHVLCVRSLDFLESESETEDDGRELARIEFTREIVIGNCLRVVVCASVTRKKFFYLVSN